MNSKASVALDEQVAQSLYAERERIYPREVHGLYATMRVLAVVILLGLFYGVLWLHWDGQQLLLFDLPARRFHIFGLTLFPQDFFYLTAILIIGALTLFFFTALAGRLWCGYACPQTVWTEVFLWIERKVEGDRRNHEEPLSTQDAEESSRTQINEATLRAVGFASIIGHLVVPAVRILGGVIGRMRH